MTYNRTAESKPYRFALLDPRNTPDARAANDSVFALGPVLGIEVTIPGLADRCALGNIDPQHSGSDATRTAIEEAMTWPVPSVGSVLATIRPDLDAFGAMALLMSRNVGPSLTRDVRVRVNFLAAADRFDHGPWQPVTQGTEPHRTGNALAPLGAAVRIADHPCQRPSGP